MRPHWPPLVKTRRALLAVLVGLCLAALPAQALPDPNKPIDPTKRAPVSTANAVKPAAMPKRGNGVVPGRVIRMSEIPIRRARVSDQQPVAVREAREKKVVAPQRREFQVRRGQRTQRASDLPASIPRLPPEHFQTMLAAYETGRIPADAWQTIEVTPAGQRVSIGEINRFAGPRATLEAQGIPVTPAATQPASAETSTPVPVPAEKNAGAK